MLAPGSVRSHTIAVVGQPTTFSVVMPVCRACTTADIATILITSELKLKRKQGGRSKVPGSMCYAMISCFKQLTPHDNPAVQALDRGGCRHDKQQTTAIAFDSR